MQDREKASGPQPDVQSHEHSARTQSHNTDALLIYTTFPSDEEAKKAGRAAVEKGLAACVNVLGQMTSIYIWEGNAEEDLETVAIFKTTRGRCDELLEEIKRLHPYSVPARLVLPVTGGGSDFLEWIGQQCGNRAKFAG